MITPSVIAYAPMTILPQFLQGLLGYPALNSGLAQSPRGLGAMIGMPLVGLLISRIDSRALIGAGFFLTAVREPKSCDFTRSARAGGGA